VAFVIMNALQVRLGFGFSAGLFDYVLNFSRGHAAVVAAAGRARCISPCTTDCSASSLSGSI